MCLTVQNSVYIHRLSNLIVKRGGEGSSSLLRHPSPNPKANPDPALGTWIGPSQLSFGADAALLRTTSKRF